VFSLNAYFDKNYGNRDGTFQASEDDLLYTQAITDAIDPAYRNSGTRYEIYLREIALGNTRAQGNNPGDILLNRDETGRPMCSANISPYAYRRTLIVAGVDCSAHPVQGQTNNVPVEEYFKVFLTEPISQSTENPPKLTIYGEVIGSAGRSGYTSAGDGGIFRDVVQLYR
jgi:hypothetical protein